MDETAASLRIEVGIRVVATVGVPRRGIVVGFSGPWVVVFWDATYEPGEILSDHLRPDNLLIQLAQV